MLGKEIKNMVIVKMEEYTPYGPSSGSTLLVGGDRLDEVKPVYSYVAQHLAEAANEMLMIVPIHKLLYKESRMAAVADTDDNQIGYIPLPIDYLRLHTLKMNGWTRPVHRAVHEGEPSYDLQFTRWTRGTRQKPVVVLAGKGSTLDTAQINAEIISADEIESALNDWETRCRNKGEWVNKYWQTYPNGEVVMGYYDMENDEARSKTYSSPHLQYFSVAASNTHIVDTFTYIPVFSESRDYDRRVAEVIALNCARKVYEVYGQTEQIGIITSEINSVLENMRQ